MIECEVTYEVAGRKWTFRKFHNRDLIKITGKLGVLPVSKGSKKDAETVRAIVANLEMGEALLAACAVRPRISIAYQTPTDELVPVDAIDQPTFDELVRRLCADSGFSAEAAEEIRPTSGTPASS